MVATKRLFLILLVMLNIILVGCSRQNNEEYVLFSSDVAVTKEIRRVNMFPNIPDNYQYFDYRSAAIALDQLVFSFAESDEVNVPNYVSNNVDTWFPIGFFDDARVGIPDSVSSIYYKKMSFGIPSYLGDRRSSSDGPYESMATIPMVLGSSFVGIDKSNQMIGTNQYNFVDMMKSFYYVSNRLVLNHTSNTIQGKSAWYDLYPQINFARLYDLYREDEAMRSLVVDGASQWLESLPYMVDEFGHPDFEYTGFDVTFNLPYYRIVSENPLSMQIEPPMGGLAFLFYTAYEITKNIDFLNGATYVLDHLETYKKNPNYEAMSDFSPWVAAAMNAKYGTQYDIQKFIDFVFENDSSFRPNWSVLSTTYNGYPVYGLVGDQDYAFAMNSFNLASTLAPMVKYDPRFANDIGKYLLNVVNNAKWFFPKQIPSGNQSMTQTLSFDPNGVICYEGLRRSNGSGVSPWATGDSQDWGAPSDLSLYSASHIGYLGSIVSETNIEGILSFDLNATDSFGENSYPTHLYYNPFQTKQVIQINVGSGNYDLFDSVTKQVVARNVTGIVNVDIAKESSRIITTLPAHSRYQIIDNGIYVNQVLISRYQAAVNIISPGHSRYTLSSGDVIHFSFFAPKNDAIIRMEVFYDDILVYDGEAIDELSYQKNQLPNTDYELRVIIHTQNGLKDQSSTRVICN